jgi:hypothetical protein
MQMRLYFFVCTLLSFACTHNVGAVSPHGSRGLHVVSSQATELKLYAAPKILRWDTIATTGSVGGGALIKAVRPVMNTIGETAVSTAVNAEIISAVRELISVPDRGAWRVKLFTFFGRVYHPDGSSTPFVRSGSGVYGLPRWNSVDSNVMVPWLSVEYLGQASAQHIARILIPSAQREKITGKWLICDSLSLTIEFAVDKKRSSAENPGFAGSHFSYSSSTLNNEMVPVWTASGHELSGAKRTSNSKLSKKPVLMADSSRPEFWYKVSVKESGVYKITAEQLSKAGVSLSINQVPTIKLYGRGGEELPELPSMSEKNTLNEISILVNTNPDGSFRDLTFYGQAPGAFVFNSKSKRFEHTINNYGVQSFYFLTWGGLPGLRAVPQQGPTGPFAHTPNKFTARVFQEEELINAYGGGSGRRWFGQQIDAVLPRTFATKLPGLVRDGTVEYVLDVAHKEIFSSLYNATVSVSDNGSKLADIPLLGVNSDAYAEYVSRKAIAEMPAQLLNQDGTSYLRFEYSNPYVSGGGNAFLDFFEIHYPAVCSAVNDELTLYTDEQMVGSAQYSVSGFTSSSLLGFDVTNPAAPVLLANTSSVGNIYQFSLSLDSMKPRVLHISAKVRTPEISKITWNYLRDDDFAVDVIVISADEFTSSASEFAKYRESVSDLDVRVFTASSVMNEFGFGINDPSAIRDFVSHAARNWSKKPRYVVLWGDGHYDFKNIATSRINHLPSWQTNEVDVSFNQTNIGYYTGSYNTDDFYVRIFGDDEITDIPLGRMPIESREIGAAMVQKIKHYEQSSAGDLWRTTATFVADDGPTSNGRSDGDMHISQSEMLTADTSCVPADIIQRKIYMAEYPAENIPKGKLKPRVTEDLLSAINNQGTVLLNWIGHGNPKVWAHETILSRDVTIPQFSNYDKLFFLIAATCDFARWDMPESQSGAELMLTSTRGGAIGAFSSSRVSFSTFNAIIGRALFRRIFTRDANGSFSTLGDIVNDIKQRHSGENDQKYMLLGDPTLRLALPDLVVGIDSINGESASDKTLTTVKATSTVRIQGHIRKFATPGTVSDFNGVATVSMYDADVPRTFMDPSAFSIGDSSTYQISKFGGSLHRGNYKVSNGRFSAQYVVPKDIAFTDKNGRLYVYARSEDNRHARGFCNNFVVGGIDTTDRDDYTGPELKIYLDNTSFIRGDVVRSNPLLLVHMRDETGINSTGLGVGHKIEAWIDDSRESVDLSESYASSLTDSRLGVASTQLFDLAPGSHTARVRVWDVLNNYSEEETQFIVAASDSNFVSGRVLVYPNPFSENTTILFTHNQSFPMSVTAQIYSVNGKCVRRENIRVTGLQSGSFVWDGKDADGNEMPSGVYPVVLSVTTVDGSVSTVTAMAVLHR